MKRYLGLVICIFLVATIANKFGLNTFIDLYSFILVFGGGIGFALLKGRTDNYLSEFGNGTIYFGWIGAIMGIIAIMAYSSFKTLNDLESIAPAFAVALTTLFYGYMLKLVAVTFSEPE